MKTKTIIIIGVVVAILAVAYFAFGRSKTTTTAGAASVALGTKKSGPAYYEADVKKEMDIIRNDKSWFEIIKANALRDSEETETTLRKNAIWMIENTH